MRTRMATVKVPRFDPSKDKRIRYQTYRVPIQFGMSILDALEYIYENLDTSLGYYGHAACRRGVCGRCTLIINGKASLACQTLMSMKVTIEPPGKFKVIRDLAYSTT